MLKPCLSSPDSNRKFHCMYDSKYQFPSVEKLHNTHALYTSSKSQFPSMKKLHNTHVLCTSSKRRLGVSNSNSEINSTNVYRKSNGIWDSCKFYDGDYLYCKPSEPIKQTDHTFTLRQLEGSSPHKYKKSAKHTRQRLSNLRFPHRKKFHNLWNNINTTTWVYRLALAVIVVVSSLHIENAAAHPPVIYSRSQFLNETSTLSSEHQDDITNTSFENKARPALFISSAKTTPANPVFLLEKTEETRPVLTDNGRLEMEIVSTGDRFIQQDHATRKNTSNEFGKNGEIFSNGILQQQNARHNLLAPTTYSYEHSEETREVNSGRPVLTPSQHQNLTLLTVSRPDATEGYTKKTKKRKVQPTHERFENNKRTNNVKEFHRKLQRGR